jgi:hypothetical protein
LFYDCLATKNESRIKNQTMDDGELSVEHDASDLLAMAELMAGQLAGPDDHKEARVPARVYMAVLRNSG